MKNIAHPLLLIALLGVVTTATLPAATSEAVKQAAIRSIAEAPLSFEPVTENGRATQFIGRGRDCTFLLSPTEATLAVSKNKRLHTVRLTLERANPNVVISGVDQLAAHANYFIGADESQWRSDIPLFSRVQLTEVYPGIDMVYYADQSAQLEYDFLLKAGADPKQISFRITGADKVRVDKEGNLALKIGGQEILQHKPVIYQTVNGARKEIVGGYKFSGKNTVTFWIAEYDHALPLVIDPVLAFSSYGGGKNGDAGWDIATDTNGNVYVCGEARGPFQVRGPFGPLIINGNGLTKAFIVKFAPSNSNVLNPVYVSYLAGTFSTAARGIAADSAGNAYITGFTDSPDFPTYKSIYKKIAGFNNTSQGFYRSDAFVTKINSRGSLVFSTFLGGGERESGNAIALDSTNNVYVAGFTESPDFPVVVDRAHGAKRVVQSSSGSSRDGFITKIAASGTRVLYSTYLGGAGLDSAQGIAVDANGNAYITGYTSSQNFPAVPAKNSYLNGTPASSSSFDAFFTKISANGATNLYSAFLGGGATDVGMRIAVLGESAFLTGYTFSSTFPTVGKIINTRAWPGAYQDVFVTKYSPTNTAKKYFKEYSVRFGSSGPDQPFGIAVNAAGEACIAGFTTRVKFFATNVVYGTDGFYDWRSSPAISGTSQNVFVGLLSADATAFRFGALIGGSSGDVAHGVALDASGENAYLVGGTKSPDFPTHHSLEPRPGGIQKSNDVFVAVVSLQDLAVVENSRRLVRPTPISLLLSITQTNGNVKITWPVTDLPLVLESSAEIMPLNWLPVGVLANSNAGQLTVTLPATNNHMYFRLREDVLPSIATPR